MKAVRLAASAAAGPFAVLLTLLWLLYYALLARYMVLELSMNDFGKFYYSAAAFLDGQDMYAPNLATEIPIGETESKQFLNLNPPHFHLLMLPFAAFSPGRALGLWAAISLMALIMSLRLIARELRIQWTRARVLWTAFGAIICSAMGTIVITGQLTFVLLLPVTLAWIAARRGNWNRAALYLGACASVKPFLGIFLLYLVLARSLRSAAVMATTGMTCVLVGLAVFGTEAYARWLGTLSSVDWAWASMNGSIAGIVTRAFADAPFYTPLVDAPSIVRPATVVLVCALTVLSLAWLLRARPNADRTFGGLLLTAQLVSPLGWIYYLPLVAGPGVALWQSSRLRPNRLRDGLAILAIPGLVIPVVMTTLWNDSPWVGLTIGSIYGWTTLFLWGSLMADSMGSRMHAPASAEAESNERSLAESRVVAFVPAQRRPDATEADCVP